MGIKAEVSTVIASRGHSSHLGRSVKTALGQSAPPLDVVVVPYANVVPAAAVADERVAWRPELGSTERPPRAHKASEPRVESGSPSSRIVTFGAPEHLETLIGACDEKAAEFGYCAAWLVDAERRIRGFSSVPVPERLRPALWAHNAIGSPSSVVVRRSLWECAGGFDEWLEPFGHWDLWVRWSRCARMCMSSEPTVAQAIGEHSGEALARELRELRRRYGGDAKADGVRFGAARAGAPEAALDGSPRPPWLVEAMTAAGSVDTPER